MALLADIPLALNAAGAEHLARGLSQEGAGGKRPAPEGMNKGGPPGGPSARTGARSARQAADAAPGA
jgi:hypothetical protein